MLSSVSSPSIINSVITEKRILLGETLGYLFLLKTLAFSNDRVRHFDTKLWFIWLISSLLLSSFAEEVNIYLSFAFLNLSSVSIGLTLSYKCFYLVVQGFTNKCNFFPINKRGFVFMVVKTVCSLYFGINLCLLKIKNCHMHQVGCP